ncbi:hypothetical protein CQW23_03848 [Capsicum baccatum]|uniref:Uncharacterized protein n=1 Tax=Capsicum baccatum TaxID=33114 RepID=A0A2G2XCY1_CAPBA|nr:hypothetical protein CQW23_03848 [Capsicum baccatum]
MQFGLKNDGATYMRSMTIIFHDMMHKEIEVYVDDVIIKSKSQADHVKDLRKFFERLRRYNLKLNPAKCVFGVSSGKLLGFVVSHRGIELDPSKIKAIQNLPPPKNRTEVMSLLGRLNYISRFIAQLITTCEPIFKLLKKSAAVKWTEECLEAFDRIKRYLSNPLVLVPPEPGRPLILYLSVMDNSFGCVLGQHDVTGKKEQAIYYLSKKFTAYDARYTLLERTYCALTWVAQKLKHYLSSYTTYLISRMDPLKYIFQKPMSTGRLAKWQILLTEFDIVYVTRTAIKAQALVDHFAENPIDEEYEPLQTYFPDEEVSCVDEVVIDADPSWRLFFYGAVNMKGVEIGAVLISESGQYFPVTTQLRFYCSNNMVEYEACILGLRLAVDMGVQELLVLGDSDLLVHQIQGDWEMRDLKIIPYRQCLQDLYQRFVLVKFRHIPRIRNEIADALATLSSMLQHPDKAYIDPVHIQSCDQYTYCNTVEEELDGEPWFLDIKWYIQSGEYPAYATNDQKRTIRRLASAMAAPWPFVTWGMDVIGPIEPKASNGHRFILVAIDYFTKWVEVVTFKSVTKKAVVDFVHANIICKFGIPKMIITDNAANLNSHLMQEVCLQFKITHRNSTPYRPKANGAVEAANKNIKKDTAKNGATPYLLVYGTEAVIPAEVEIPSLRVIVEAEIDDDEWVKAKGKFSPNWQGPFVVKKVLPNGALYLTDIEGKMAEMAINADAVKRYYVFMPSVFFVRIPNAVNMISIFSFLAVGVIGLLLYRHDNYFKLSSYGTLDSNGLLLIDEFVKKNQMDMQNSELGHVIKVHSDILAQEKRNKICGSAQYGFSDVKTMYKDAQERSKCMRKPCMAVVLCIIFKVVMVVRGIKANGLTILTGCIIFMDVKVVGVIKDNSLAILMDVAHLLSHIVAFAISLFSLWELGCKANPLQSYGFFRIEILRALVSIGSSYYHLKPNVDRLVLDRLPVGSLSTKH